MIPGNDVESRSVHGTDKDDRTVPSIWQSVVNLTEHILDWPRPIEVDLLR